MNDIPSLPTLLAGAQLPALPQSAIRLLELSQDPENGPAEFAVPIEADPGLTGQVLRFVNSSYFGFSREISSVKLAITLVGIRTIKNFALWSAVFSLVPNPKCGPFDLKRLWQDSLRRALFARRMGKILGVNDGEELFAAALLQDMAVPLLARELADAYVDLLSRRDGGARRLSELERDVFGWTHADAAGVIARGWSLPAGFVKLVEMHADPSVVETTGADGDVLAVCLSALLPTATDSNWPERQALIDAYQRHAPQGAPTLAELLDELDGEFDQFAPMLNVGTPPRTLAQCLAEDAVVDA